MFMTRGRLAALALALLASPIAAQDGPDGLAVGRQMLAEDNPGELWVARGQRLFFEKRGPKKASLESCDLGLGPGKVEGAFAQLPRYFADTDKVQDLESRLMTCMVTLQGFTTEDILRNRFGTLDNDSDMEALVSFIGSKSNGMKMNVPLRHAKEAEAYKAGEYLFHRRSGPLDFSCATCHADQGRRIRLQELPNMTDSKQVQTVVATGWPAYRGTQATVRTMQHRLYDCNWQMRLPDLGYASDMSIALTSYLNHRGNGGVVQLPGVRR
ncbi:MAG: SoxAX cytochrome complex subunit [Betaproteobacteria bacterium]|jgi:sulfur-oxidizing protein SoxA|nr:SoxAX cytochrome complex subunit [Betaproteobacteria bacterium]